jgi:MFS family permease
VRTFSIIWSGQLVSTIGSYMTEFALTLWVWQITGSATALSLVVFFSQLPRIPISLFAGAIVDRCDRKHLMMVGDAIAALCTIAILLLHITGNLQVWHLFVTSAVKSAFGEIQFLAYSASIALVVPKQHYTRASSMGAAVHYGSSIVAPAIASIFYPLVGLVGILLIDLITFAIAIYTLLLVTIPQPTHPEQDYPNIWQELIVGYRYIVAHPSLLALLISMSLFVFAHDIGDGIYSPMILAITGNNATLLATLYSAAGIGGVVGAFLVSIWGGPKRRIHGMLIGFIGAGLSKTIFGLSQSLFIWIPAQFSSSLNFPLLGSADDAIWLTKVQPHLQGRVFANRSVAVQICGALASLIAGPLADYVFEPAMIEGGNLWAVFGGIFGTGKGAGMGLLYVISSVSLLLVGAIGYTFRLLRDVESIVPDHDAELDSQR